MNQNKKIAEFMGMKPHHQDSGCLTRVDDNGSNEVVPIEELAYHTSWDWLMPVVEKCYELGAEGECIGDITMYLTDVNIQGTYKAVVEFIEGLSVESVETDTKAIDEAFFEGFCLALEYAKDEIESADDVEFEVDESVGDLYLSGTISIDISEHMDTDSMMDSIKSRYERDNKKDGSNA
jgi:hypothetical protein